MRKQPVTVRAARWCATHPWRAIVGWLVFVVLCLVLGSVIGSRSATSADYRVGEAGRAEAMAEAGGLTQPAIEKILIEAKSGSLDSAQADAAAADVTERMRGLAEVASVDAPVRSPGGDALMVPVSMKGDPRDANNYVQPLLKQTAAAQSAYPGLRIEETGDASVGNGLNTQRGNDLALSEEITLPITLVILLLVFGSLLTACVPVLLAITSIAGAMGLYELASHIFPDAGVGNQVILLMGMAVGVDYALFYLKREREERRRAGGKISAAAAVELAAATSGRAVVMSGLAVMASTACLFFADDVIFSSLAAGTLIVVVVAVISSLTVLPALLTKLGDRVDRRLWRRKEKTANAGEGKLWPALLRPAMKRPVVTLLVATVVMLGLAVPALGLKLGTPSDDTYSRSVPELQVADRLAAAFPDERAHNLIVLNVPSAQPGQVRTALSDLAARAQADPLFAGNTNPAIEVSADGAYGTLILGVPYVVSSDQALQALLHLRNTLAPSTLGQAAGARYAVSGDVAHNIDYVDHQNQQLPWVLGFALLLTFLMTAFTFRSVVIAAVGVVLNLLSAAAAFGLLVLVFQGSWTFAENLLDFTSIGFIGSRVPLFLFVILFGLSMDYQIFVVSRIREGALRGLSTRDAVYQGLTSSASVVTSAAVVMVSVFVSFMLLHLLELKQMGFGLAVAVLLDAIVVRIFILPSAISLLGRATWWPSRAFRRGVQDTTGQVPLNETTVTLSQPIP